MNQEAYHIILQLIRTPLEEKEFSPVKGREGVYSNGKQAYQVIYREENRVFELQSAELEESGEFPEDWDTVSTYLFDENSTEKDAKSVGLDFAETLEEKLGIRKKKQSPAYYAPPKAPKNANNLDRFTQRFLALFPAYKENYSRMMERYGQFLPDTFFAETAAPLMIDLLRQGDKKALTKFFDLLNTFYMDGNAQVRSIINATIVYELGGHREYEPLAMEYMSEFLQKNAVPMIRMAEKEMKRKKKAE